MMGTKPVCDRFNLAPPSQDLDGFLMAQDRGGFMADAGFEKLEAPTRFPVAPVRPLRHLSARDSVKQGKNVRALLWK